MVIRGRNEGKEKYSEVRDNLKRSVESMESLSEEFRAESEHEVSAKWENLKAKEEGYLFFIIMAGALYLVLMIFLGIGTYQSLARPFRQVEKTRLF